MIKIKPKSENKLIEKIMSLDRIRTLHTRCLTNSVIEILYVRIPIRGHSFLIF